MHPHLEPHYNRLYGETAGSDYNSDLDASYDVDSISVFDDGVPFVPHVGQPQILEAQQEDSIHWAQCWY